MATNSIHVLGVSLAATFALAAQTTATAAVEFSTPFGDGMVLQRGRPVPVWGAAAPGEAVVVRFAGQEKRTAADAEGRWRVNASRYTAKRPRCQWKAREYRQPRLFMSTFA